MTAGGALVVLSKKSVLRKAVGFGPVEEETFATYTFLQHSEMIHYFLCMSQLVSKVRVRA